VCATKEHLFKRAIIFARGRQALSIASSEEAVSSLTSGVCAAANQLHSMNLISISYSDFPVEVGYSAANNSAGDLSLYLSSIMEHVAALVSSTSTVLADTDSALSIDLLNTI
jgi:hypothetical protein